VFCADGAGGYCGTSSALREAFACQRIPLLVEMVDWSQGLGIAPDHFNWQNVEVEGQRLARRVLAWRAAYPGQPVYLIGHSAGCAVVLFAAGCLPPDSVDRIVLFAPSVSADYDIRPALASARLGIDAFISRRDWVALGIGTRLFGTTDRRWSAAAGRVGFRPQGNCPGDAALYARLRQHPWHPCQAWTGNEGGHYGSYTPGFLNAYVLPLLPPAGAVHVSARQQTTPR
jgi:pimeloyl-ACP methyl ester carboxylesterase